MTPLMTKAWLRHKSPMVGPRTKRQKSVGVNVVVVKRSQAWIGP